MVGTETARPNGIHFVGFRRLARGDAGDYPHRRRGKLGGLRRFSDVNIRSDRVRLSVSSSRLRDRGCGPAPIARR